MARFPKIQSPCPLSRAEQREIDGHCARCDKTVHDLDAMGEADRAAFMAARSSPVCVKWQASPRRSVAQWPLAFAASLAAGTAIAGAAPPSGGPLSSAEPVATPTSDPKPMQMEDWESMTVFVGGIDDPAAAEWIDDDTLETIPTVIEPMPPEPR